MVFVKSKDATSYYNVSDSTLRKWAREKLIRTETTKGGHWRYWIEDKSQQSNTPQNSQTTHSSQTLEAELITIAKDFHIGTTLPRKYQKSCGCPSR